MPRRSDRHPVHSRADARIARAVDAVLDLSRSEQRRAFLQLAEYLGAPAEEESERTRIARQRSEAMEDLGRVAERLGLADGRAPTRAQYESLTGELGLRHTASAVAELWNGRWRQAAFEFTGRASYESEEMLALRVRARQAARADPKRRERYALDCLRRWLDTDPPARRAAAYGRWAAAQNDDGADPPLYSLTSLRESLSVEFGQALAVADGRTTLEAARGELARREAAADASPLVQRAEAARILDVRPSRMKQLLRRDVCRR